MEEIKEKPRILINPPPRDFHCEICGRKFEDLPVYPENFKSMEIFSGHRVFNKDHTEVKLFKTYRGSYQVSASWECFECLNSCTIDDVSSYFCTDDPYECDGLDHTGEHIKMEHFLNNLKTASDEAKGEYFIMPDPDCTTNEFNFSTRYWKRYFERYGDNYKQEE